MVTPKDFIAIAWSWSKKGLNSFRHSTQWGNFCLKTEKDYVHVFFSSFSQRTLRVLVMHASYTTQAEKQHLQKSLFSVVEAILAKCADSNRCVNSLIPNIHLQILQSDLYTFPLRIS